MTLTARASAVSVTYAWRQTAGPRVSLTANGAATSFTAPASGGATLAFEVAAVSP